jgi:hypothetical protein
MSDLEKIAKEISADSGNKIKDLMLARAKKVFGDNFPEMEVALSNKDTFLDAHHYTETERIKGIVVVENKGKGHFNGNQYVVLTPGGLMRFEHSRYDSSAENELPSFEDSLVRSLHPADYHRYVSQVFCKLKDLEDSC